MRKIAILGLSILAFAGCNNTTNQPTNTANISRQNSSNTLAVTSHSSENKTVPKTTTQQPTGSKTKWTQSGDPIDTSKFDADVADAEKNLKAKPDDDGAKKALAEAYVKRGEALTNARQYASALGDYRRALKYDPNNAAAKNWIDQIVGIYQSINREYPPEGEEPPPLPFNK